MNVAIKWTTRWAVVVVAGLGALATPAVAAKTEVTVIRGTASDAASGQPGGGLPTVLRGWPPGAKRVRAKPEPELQAAGGIATGGETLWLLERGGERMIGCWL